MGAFWVQGLQGLYREFGLLRLAFLTTLVIIAVVLPCSLHYTTARLLPSMENGRQRVPRIGNVVT